MSNPPTYDDYLDLANNSYTNAVPGEPVTQAPPGWTAIAATAQPDAGFAGTAYRNNTTGDIVIAYAGTQADQGVSVALGDAVADDKIASGVTPEGNSLAIQFAQSVLQDNQGAAVYVDGHSLGGEYAQATMFALGDQMAGGASFGAPGVPNAPGDVGLNNSNWTNYVHSGDVIGNFTPANGDHYGNSITLPDSASASLPGEVDAQNAANIAADGNTSNVYNAMSAGQPNTYDGTLSLIASTYAAIIDHSLSSYATSNGSTLNQTDQSNSQGAIAVPSYTQPSSGTPTSDNGNISEDGSVISSDSSGIKLTPENSNSIDIVTGDGQAVNPGDDDATQIINSGNNNTITANSSYIFDVTSTTSYVYGDGNIIMGQPDDLINVKTDGVGYNGSYNDNVYMNDGTVDFASSNTYATVWGTAIMVQDASGVTGGVAGFEGNGDLATIVDGQVNAGSSNQSITIDGSNDSVYGGSWTGDQFTLGANQTDYVYGSNETIYGNGDDIVDYGNNNTIYADGSTVTDEGSDDMTYGDDDTVYGYGTGDGVGGTGDTGGTWYTGGSGGSGYSGSWGFDDASRQSKTNTVSSFDESQGNAKAVSAASIAWSKASQAIAAATIPGMAQPSAINTARWGRTTITWSFADGPTSGADAISGAVQAQYQAAVAQAFQTWAAASGITFTEVGSSAKSDIAVGWGDLDPTDSGALGYTNTTTRGGLIQGATIRLEDPSEDALVADTNGAYAYSGATTTLEQLILHEIGHTLGMAESSNINSIMFPELGTSNTTLSASDLQEIAILYPQVSPAANADTIAMAQAMASFSVHEPAAASTMSSGVYAKTFQPAIAVPAY